MANVSGKAYGLTAITRMHPLKTYGLRVVFAGIELSLMPPGRRGAIAMAVAGPLLVAVVDGLVRVRNGKVLGVDSKRLIVKANAVAAELALQVMP